MVYKFHNEATRKDCLSFLDSTQVTRFLEGAGIFYSTGLIH